MNTKTYDFYIMFELQSKISLDGFKALNDEFSGLLEANKPDEACDLIQRTFDAITIDEVKKVSGDENNFTYNRVEYVAVDGVALCFECAFYKNELACGLAPACDAKGRKDGRGVIFKKKADLDREAIEGILKVSAALAKEAKEQDLQDKAGLEQGE